MVKKKSSSLQHDNRKDDLKESQEPTWLTLCRFQCTKPQSFYLKQDTISLLLEKSHLGNWFPRIPFTVLGHLGTQRSLKSWSKSTWLLLYMAADWPHPHVTGFLVMQNATVNRVIEVSTQISKEYLCGQTVCPWKGRAWSCKNEAKTLVEIPEC